MTGTLHALASTGGTIVCRALATHSRVLVLSEISPAAPQASRFVPDTPFAHLLASPLVSGAERRRLFRQQMNMILSYASQRDWRVLVRDHPHSDFMHGDDASGESSLVRVMGDALGPRATWVRHPIDSYLSSVASGFLGPSVQSLDAYCQRLLRFDAVHGQLRRFRYEDFCLDPDQVLKEMSGHLGLPYESQWRDRIGAVKLSGSSGRAGDEVTARARRPIPPDVETAARASASLNELCQRWGYLDEPTAQPDDEPRPPTTQVTIDTLPIQDSDPI